MTSDSRDAHDRLEELGACKPPAVRHTHRTAIQTAANEIDMELFRLLTRAERLYGDTKATRETKHYSIELCHAIRSARANARLLMHADDRERTS